MKKIDLDKIKCFSDLDDKDLWLTIVKDVIESSEFEIRKKFLHHHEESLYEHLIKVSITSYKLAKKYKLNISNATLAGLLHDFYSQAWLYSNDLSSIDPKYSINLNNKVKKKFLQKHGFMHGLDSALNIKKYYPDIYNPIIHDAVAKHMFPLSIFTKEKIPKYKESWVVSLADKIVSFKNFPRIKEIPKYLGLKRG